VLDAKQRKDQRADEGKRQADPVDDGRVRIAVGDWQENANRRAERGDLREREVDEDDAPLDDVHTEIGVDAGQDQARHEWRGEELQNGHVHATSLPFPWPQR
jgi:hypothetical protein